MELSNRNVTALAMLAHARAVGGDRPGARELLVEIEALRHTPFVSPVDLAVVHVALGEPGSAQEWLEQGYRERAHWMALLGIDARFDPLRSTPAFRALLDRLPVS